MNRDYTAIRAPIDGIASLATASQRIVAIFPNPGNILRRGQFVRVRMRADVRRGALLVPQRAVSELQGTYQVVVVGADNKAETRPVKAGRRVEHTWIIEEGHVTTPSPLWRASGSGARQVMGTTVIGGMLAATLIAIFLIPVTDYVIERFAANRR